MFTVRFTRAGSYPVKPKTDTPENEIETLEIPEEDTYIYRGKRLYDLIIGHGITLKLPVEEKQ